MLISIDGAKGTGKTVLSNSLKPQVPNSVLWYHRHDPYPEHKRIANHQSMILFIKMAELFDDKNIIFNRAFFTELFFGRYVRGYDTSHILDLLKSNIDFLSKNSVFVFLYFNFNQALLDRLDKIEIERDIVIDCVERDAELAFNEHISELENLFNTELESIKDRVLFLEVSKLNEEQVIREVLGFIIKLMMRGK